VNNRTRACAAGYLRRAPRNRVCATHCRQAESCGSAATGEAGATAAAYIHGSTAHCPGTEVRNILFAADVGLFYGFFSMYAGLFLVYTWFNGEFQKTRAIGRWTMYIPKIDLHTWKKTRQRNILTSAQYVSDISTRAIGC